jgi:hypothetical protein
MKRKITFVVTVCLMALFFCQIKPIHPLAERKIEVPEYSLAGITPDILYLIPTKGFFFSFRNPKLIPYAKEMGKEVITQRIFFIDTTGNGIKDLWHVEYEFPQRKEKKMIIPAFKQVQLYVGVTKDETRCERILIDRMNKEGNLGSDGEFEDETRPKNNPFQMSLPSFPQLLT